MKNRRTLFGSPKSRRRKDKASRRTRRSPKSRQKTGSAKIAVKAKSPAYSHEPRIVKRNRLSKHLRSRRQRAYSSIPQNAIRQFIAWGQWLLLAVLPARLGAMAFLGTVPEGWVAAILGALLLGTGLFIYFRRREEDMLLIQYQHLLGYLNTRLSAGIPLEKALASAVNPVTEQIGHRNAVARALKRLTNNLQAQMALRPALTAFVRDVNLPNCQRDFTILSLLSNLGGKIDVYVRQTHHDLTAQINAKIEVAHERRGNTSEAVILSLIPFVMAQFVNNASGTYSGSLSPETITLPMAVLYIMAMVAIFILFTALAPKKTAMKKPPKKKQKKRKSLPDTMSPVARLLSKIYLDVLPGQLGLSLASAVCLPADDQDAAWARYMNQKVYDLSIGTAMAVVIAFSSRPHPLVVLLIVLIIPLLRDLSVASATSKRREEYRFHYPSVINTLYILLESGLTLDRALRIVAQVALPQTRTQRQNPVASDLRQAVLRLDTGFNSAMAAQHLAERCPLPEIQAALHLMARYEREGGREILDLIHMQAERGRQLYRDAIRGRAEQRSLLLTLPMAIDLMVVMATVVLPAILSMRSFS
ncbi:MAG: type II secretion system F family protein [Clostridiaceae bacterium]|jgi:Flp pilus assembly protein TadB|nr:type II secretion system F family protein [Clostridiaceae bacterium]